MVNIQEAFKNRPNYRRQLELDVTRPRLEKTNLFDDRETTLKENNGTNNKSLGNPENC